MTAYIVHTESLMRGKSYSSKGRAQAAFKRMNDGRTFQGYSVADFSIMDTAEYNAADVMVETRNLMSGTILKIRLSEKGGCTDPGTERYWTMQKVVDISTLIKYNVLTNQGKGVNDMVQITGESGANFQSRLN